MTCRLLQPRSAFTAIELLVSIGIVIILLVIFVPYVLSLREHSRRTQCADNLRQIDVALRTYGNTVSVDRRWPRVKYDAVNLPNSYTAYTGPDDPDSFASESGVGANDVTASLFLLVRHELIRDLRVYVCPSSGDEADRLTDAGGKRVTPTQRANFRSHQNLSYAIASPFSAAAGYRHDDLRVGDFAVMADRSPGVLEGNAGITGVSVGGLASTMIYANSPNHAGAGQNVLYADGTVEWKSSIYVGHAGRYDGRGDNIFTALALTPLIPDEGNGSPAPAVNVRGYWGRDVGPAWDRDSYLIPTVQDR